MATAQNLVVSGSTTVEKRFFNQPASLQGATGVAIKFVPVGSGAGLVDLAEGKAGVAASSESLADTIEGAQKVAKDASKPFTTPAGLQFHEIARDRIVAIVHPSNPVKSLTLDQLRELNTGKMRIIDSPGIGRPLGLITIGAPSQEAGKLIEHLRKTSMASR